MASQSRCDFFRTLGVIRATTASHPNTANKTDEESYPSQFSTDTFIDTAISNDHSLYKIVCLFQIPVIRSVESIEYSIVLILILRFINR